MRNLLLSAVAAGALFSAGVAHAACGDITLSVFSWQSAEAMSNVDQFILKNGYGCNATAVAGDTVPTITAMVEKGQPDVASEATPSLLGDVATKGLADKRIIQIGTAISDGEASGWFIPQYVADAHPEIKTVDDEVGDPSSANRPRSNVSFSRQRRSTSRIGVREMPYSSLSSTSSRS